MVAALLEVPAASSETSAEPIELSVVMPCLNESLTVGVCVRKAVEALKQMGVRGEVIVADNGSTDGSQDLARQAGARVVHASRRGYGSALQAGIEAARGEYVVMGDADDSYDFTNLSPFLEKLRAGDELVMGNRFRGGIEPGAMPWHHRYIGNPILTGVLNLFFHSPIGDAHCGLRGFRRDSVLKLNLKTSGMEFASEMVVKACLHKQKISEVPTTLKPDGRDRPPHLRSFRDGWRHLRFLMLMCPFWTYLIPAVSLMVAGFGLMAWLTPGPRHVRGVEIDIHTMLFGGLWLLIGYQIFWMWAFAKIHGWTSGLLPANTFSTKLFDKINLERGLIAGGLMIAGGIGTIVWLTYEWSSHNMGPLEPSVTMRYAIWGFVLLLMGVQTVFGSFFLSMLDMARPPAPLAPSGRGVGGEG
jgi:glycosyltransferase involved in cell wall biosynthesis